MLNYMRSEIYRIIRSRSFYICAGILCGIVLLLHIALMIGGAIEPDFSITPCAFL